MTMPIESHAEEYTYKAYPKMIYHPDGSNTTVADKEELALHLATGWSLTQSGHTERIALELQVDSAEKDLGKLRDKLAAVIAAEEDDERGRAVKPRPTSHRKT